MYGITDRAKPRKFWRRSTFVFFLTLVLAAAAEGQPGVFVTAEGQLGETPGLDGQVAGTRFESIRGAAGDVLLGGIFVFGGAMPPPPEMSFLTDTVHGIPEPMPVGSAPSLFADVFKTPPASARIRNAADDGDLVAFSFAVDGLLPQTMSVRVATFDENGDSLIDVPVAQLDTFPDPVFNATGVAVDDKGRVTVVYSELSPPFDVQVKARRLDASTGTATGGEIPVTGLGQSSADVALLDPAGNRLIIATSDFVDGHVKGRVLDTTGAAPVVLPEFQISTTAAAFGNLNPAVAADLASGAFTVVWENLTGNAGDPVNLRGRRFDAGGNPVGGDFPVNTTTANDQGQPAAAYGPGGESVVVWAGTGTGMGMEDLDVFGQAYDAMGNPIGGEFRANTETSQVQDQPTVRFLPEPDGNGQPQFVVAWRDVGDTSGNAPRGTGTSYKCFSIGEDPSLIFTDGFESGNTSSWSDIRPRAE